MSSRGRNHTRGTMQAWREMAADGYPASRNPVRATRARTALLHRNARWRPIVRLLAKQNGWRFSDAFFWVVYYRYGVVDTRTLRM